MRTHSFRAIKEKFSQYYKTCSNKLSSPSLIKQREFGFILLDKRIMLRHQRFETPETLKNFLTSTIPSDAYYSAAYYEHPEVAMEKKHWLGADLVFDIDADHIPTPCGKIHDRWICSKCGFAGKGSTPETCPVCAELKFNTKTWMCEACLRSAKRETVKLVDMLRGDFGFAASEVKVFFSGHRGYHVHIENERVRSLDSMARKEVVDYVIGLGFKEGVHRLVEDRRVALEVDPDGVGWRQRIVKGVYELLEESTPKEIQKLGLDKRRTNFLIENKKWLLETLKENGWINVKGVGPRNWRKILQWVVNQQSAKIDTVVTTDTHRLIRLIGSLHGKTGFMKVEAPLRSLERFDPLTEAIAFKEGQMIVDVDEAPKFRVGSSQHGPFKNDAHVELPTAAALFLLCKGAAQVRE